MQPINRLATDMASKNNDVDIPQEALSAFFVSTINEIKSMNPSDVMKFLPSATELYSTPSAFFVDLAGIAGLTAQCQRRYGSTHVWCIMDWIRFNNIDAKQSDDIACHKIIVCLRFLNESRRVKSVDLDAGTIVIREDPVWTAIGESPLFVETVRDTDALNPEVITKKFNDPNDPRAPVARECLKVILEEVFGH